MGTKERNIKGFDTLSAFMVKLGEFEFVKLMLSCRKKPKCSDDLITIERLTLK